jgi:hypothetical protein
MSFELLPSYYYLISFLVVRMPTLRQKVDVFCRDSGAKVDSDKLRRQVAALKQELKEEKAKHKSNLKAVKASAKTQKAPKPVKVKAPKALPEPMLPAPVAAPSLAPAAPPARGGRGKTRRRPVMRW